MPNHFTSIDEAAHEYEAVSFLRETASDDPVLFDEYDVVYEDLREVISNFMSIYTHPEKIQGKLYFQWQDSQYTTESCSNRTNG